MEAVGSDREFRRRMERLESLLHEVDVLAEAPVRAQVREIVQSILDLHATGLERVLERIAGGNETGMTLIDALARDDLVGSLLVLQGLHPVELDTRVRQALDKVRPYLQSHGGNVELLACQAGVVRLRMLGSCHGCPSSAITLKLAIEEAIYAMAPDVAAIEVEGAAEPETVPLPVFVPLTDLRASTGEGSSRWTSSQTP
jgi:Fe-S cluster biogenesis protein NfuA